VIGILIGNKSDLKE